MLPGLSWVWLTAYDWRACARAIARVWDHSEEHVIGWDLAGRTWGGGDFEPPSPREFAHAVACAYGTPSGLPRGPIMRYVLGDFYRPGVGSGPLETAERNALTWVAKPGNLVMTMDSDEELVNVADFVAWLQPSARIRRGRVWTGTALGVYKVIGDAALVLGPVQTPAFMEGPGLFRGPRQPPQGAQQCPLRFVNWFLADDTGANRSAEEVAAKLLAMDHMYPDRAAVFERWRSTTLENFHAVDGVGGNYPSRKLHAISLADLRAGRWEVLK